MKTLMIHSLSENHFTLPLDSYRLTFDDGLFSQFYYFPLWGNKQTEVYVFPVTGLILPGPLRKQFDGEHIAEIKAQRYMYAAFIQGDHSHFMTIDELKWIQSNRNVKFGAHSHSHDVIQTTDPLEKPNSPWKKARLSGIPDSLKTSYAIRSRLAHPGMQYDHGRLSARNHDRWRDDVRKDTEMCLEWFQRHLGIRPITYCFPFNEFNGPLLELLGEYGFQSFFAGPCSCHELVVPRCDIDLILKDTMANHA